MKFLFGLLFLLPATLIFSQEKPEGLFINSKAPEFKGTDQNGKEISLKELRKKGPVVLVFYRGNWCPYCSKHLKALQDSLQLINEKGAQVVAITPENKEGIAKMAEKTKAGFSIIPDEDMKFMKAYGVAYKVDEKTVGRYKSFDIDLAKNNSQKPDAITLPVPAVYIIDKNGEIKFRFFEPEYKKRVSVGEILQNLYGTK